MCQILAAVCVYAFLVNAANAAHYVRWGRKTCPDGATLLYNGFVGGSYYSHSGSGANHLCLTANPTFNADDDFRNQGHSARIYGAEYEVPTGYGNNNPFSFENNNWKSLDDESVPCAVCFTQRVDELMIPGTQECPNEHYHLEYKGFLVSAASNYQRSEYLCVDEAPETLGVHGNKEGALFYPVQASCGSLLCPPYRDNAEVSCVVCTV